MSQTPGRLFFAEIQVPAARAEEIMRRYAMRHGSRQYPDGSFGVCDVSVGYDHDFWSGKRTIEVTGYVRGIVEMIAEGLRRTEGIRKRAELARGYVLTV